MRSKRYLAAKTLIGEKKVYALDEALELVKRTNTVSFNATVELHVRLGIDVKKGDQNVRGTILFPHAVGKAKRVAAFVSGGKEQEARDAGADLIGGEELIKEISQSKKVAFDIAIATPDMMPKLAQIAKILGPAGLMPNPKTETVGTHVKKMIEDVKRGKISFKNDPTGIIHQPVGTCSMELLALKENVRMFIETIQKLKPASAKGVFIRSITLASSMGPGITIDPEKIG